MQLRLLLSALLVVPFNALAQDCLSVLALSRVRNIVFASASDIQSHAAHFCSEYSRNRSSQDTTRFGASYATLAESLSGYFASGRASIDQVASRYCSASNNFAASNNAFQNYVESIAPGAFGAYMGCIQMQNINLQFGVNESTILPRSFSMSVSWRQPGSQTAQLIATASDGVSCRWRSSHAARSGNDDATIVLPSPGTVLLSCERVNASERGYVTVAHENGLHAISVPWQAYTSQGIPVNLVEAMQAEVAAVSGRLATLASALNRVDMQVGNINLTEAIGTRPLTDASRCVVDGGDRRGVLQGRVIFPRPFQTIPVVTAGLSSLDVGTGRNLRINFDIISIDNRGFSYAFNTWCDTQVFSARAFWSAFAR